MSVAIGQIINGKYRVVRHIGDGGMGSVYEAMHEALRARVALKFLHAELSRTGLADRFLQEARLSARIQSPHVVRVTDADQTPNGLAFMVLEYLEGRTLQALYEEQNRQGRRLSLEDALDYAMQLFEGVEAAHAAGVVHRDLKPENVMITTDPKGAPLLKILDFGIAKLGSSEPAKGGLTQPGMILGTPEYMAPEQAYSADSADTRADVFSLGVLVFEMIAGRRPATGDGPYEIASAYLSGKISRLDEVMPGIAKELADALALAMAPLPRNRFASVRELREAIEPFAPAPRPASTMRGRVRASIPTAEAAVFPNTDPVSSPSSPKRNIPETWARSSQPGSPPPDAMPVSTTAKGTALMSAVPMGPAPPLPPPPGVAPDAVLPPPGPWPPPMEWAPAGPSIPQPPPRQRKGGNGTIVLIAIVALAAVAGFVIWSIYYFTDVFDDPPPKPVPAPSLKRPGPAPAPAPTPRSSQPRKPGNVH